MPGLIEAVISNSVLGEVVGSYLFSSLTGTNGLRSGGFKLFLFFILLSLPESLTKKF